jgi:DNA-directed RNA polymerase specialized sigma24 family protein
MLPDWLAVLTIDQRASRTSADKVDALLADLDERLPAQARLLGFERTAGDEVQGVLTDAEEAVRLTLRLAVSGDWSVGLGLGAVRTPLPSSTRAAHGEAFENARAAVERAKDTREALAVAGPRGPAAEHAEAVLRLLAAVSAKRSAAGREVAVLLAEGLTQADVAERLGITKQAVSQRAQAGLVQQELAALPAAAELLRLAGGPVVSHRS